MQKNVYINKPIGLTPLEAIDQLRKSNRAYKSVKLGYAGRLDPMAHGLLLVLVGNENKNSKKYLGLNKKYKTEALFGFETDTYDILGRIIKVRSETTVSPSEIKNVIKSFTGKREQEYPPFSSKTVQGKPLYWWARQERLSEITIPKKLVEIYSIDLLGIKEVRGNQLLKIIEERIKRVKGKFRQEDCLMDWQKILDSDYYYPLASFSIACSSGTYVRSIVHKMGKKTGKEAVAFDIQRTEIGPYRLENAVNI